MAVEFRITKGARAGARERFEKSIVAIGRHPINDLRFDAERDLDVSSRHAELRIVGDRHVLVDLGSTNGTFVNGQAVSGERALADGDVVTFGADGPQAEFRIVGEQPSVSPSRGMPTAAAAPSAPRLNTTERVAIAVEQQTGALKRIVAGLAVVVIAGALVAVWVTRKSAAETRAQLASLVAANDSLSRALEARLGETGIADASLAAARAESERLSRELREQQARGGDLSAAAAAVRESQTRTASLAGMDYAAIADANQRAIVFLVVEFPDSSKATGTGFNVLPSGLIVTNRHVVQRPDGTRAQRIAVAFDGTTGQWKRASIELVSESDELAFLRLSTAGTYPVVNGVARDDATTGVGRPVAILGYPLGTGTAGMSGSINTLTPSATLSVGTVSKRVPETVQLDAFAAQGSSGSPVFDRRGIVVGVIYGGATESGGRIVYAVPASRLAAQLPTDARAVLR
ncbi:trypsin-like peptidase domain-containing protein [Pseudogemmatithrix spongiicola]|uniref:Trypsin-like peptidase domain-containing protein n=1 Tax=Pseudogemmatithrix spongiicola TaxID=3062599 RepID=A0AA49JT49_9BACT|nr:trypsin-like peptidase domain-containing protein [Gemmatimonadaceae bacterium 'strain 138']WKW14437.1 trypsin-like peptidase domain-containing protein [Gemmatimonadaceae bacterium 'strain 318']